MRLKPIIGILLIIVSIGGFLSGSFFSALLIFVLGWALIFIKESKEDVETSDTYSTTYYATQRESKTKTHSTKNKSKESFEKKREEIDDTLREVDNEVYGLYGLSKDEIKEIKELE